MAQENQNASLVVRAVATLTPDEVVNVNEHQTDGRWHPLTCPNRGDGWHRKFNGDLGALVATRRALICPWCAYEQTTVPAFMTVAVAASTVAPNPEMAVASELQEVDPAWRPQAWLSIWGGPDGQTLLVEPQLALFHVEKCVFSNTEDINMRAIERSPRNDRRFLRLAQSKDGPALFEAELRMGHSAIEPVIDTIVMRRGGVNILV